MKTQKLCALLLSWHLNLTNMFITSRTEVAEASNYSSWAFNDFKCHRLLSPLAWGSFIWTKGRGGHRTGLTTAPFPWKSQAMLLLQHHPKGQGSLGQQWKDACCTQMSIVAEGIKSPTRRASLNYKPKLCPLHYRSKYLVNIWGMCQKCNQTPCTTSHLISKCPLTFSCSFLLCFNFLYL